MDVAQLMEMVEDRKGSRSFDRFAKEIDMNSTTLYKMISDGKKNPGRDLGVTSIKKLIAYFNRVNDREMVAALVEYATGLDSTAFKILPPS